jgi:hypothetical protein
MRLLQYPEHRKMFIKHVLIVIFVLGCMFYLGRCSGKGVKEEVFVEIRGELVNASTEINKCRELWGDIKNPNITILVRPE